MSSVLEIPTYLNMVASGSGARALENAPNFLQEAKEISGTETPVVLTIGTAEPNLEWYDKFVELSKRKYVELGATVINLHGFRTAPSEQEITDKCAVADIIRVAGGDTAYMLERWQEYGITPELEKAALRGAVLDGGSAAFLAWLKSGHSDSLSYRIAKGEAWDYIFVPGLNFVNAVGCPHYDAATEGNVLREVDFTRKWLADDTLPDFAICIDNMAALALKGGLYKALAAPDSEFPRAGVHVLTKQDWQITTHTLPVNESYQNLTLYT